MSNGNLPKYLILAEWIYGKNRHINIQEACSFMGVSAPYIRRYLKCMQGCDQVIDLSIRYSGEAIVSVKVNNIAPYKYVQGRPLRPKKHESGALTQKKLGSFYLWQKLTRSSWKSISF